MENSITFESAQFGLVYGSTALSGNIALASAAGFFFAGLSASSRALKALHMLAGVTLLTTYLALSAQSARLGGNFIRNSDGEYSLIPGGAFN